MSFEQDLKKEIKMHRVRYSRITKVIAIVFQTIFVSITAIGLSVCFSYNGMIQGTSDMLEGKEFTNTNYYESMVEERLYELSEYIRLCSVFETAGNFDSGRIINVEDYNMKDDVEHFEATQKRQKRASNTALHKEV